MALLRMRPFWWPSSRPRRASARKVAGKRRSTVRHQPLPLSPVQAAWMQPPRGAAPRAATQRASPGGGGAGNGEGAVCQSRLHAPPASLTPHPTNATARAPGGVPVLRSPARGVCPRPARPLPGEPGRLRLRSAPPRYRVLLSAVSYRDQASASGPDAEQARGPGLRAGLHTASVPQFSGPATPFLPPHAPGLRPLLSPRPRRRALTSPWSRAAAAAPAASSG